MSPRTCPPAWTLSATPSPETNPVHDLFGVATVSDQSAWAVGYRGDAPSQTLIERWDATSWTLVPSPNVGSEANSLAAVDVLTATDAWAVGYFRNVGGDSGTLVLHWDGTSWTVVSSRDVGVGSSLNSVDAVSSHDVWAVGASTAQDGTHSTLVLHWDGIAWVEVPSPNAGSLSNELWSVKAISAEDAWAVGRSQDVGGDLRALAMRWDGARWNLVTVPGQGPGANELSGVSGSASDDVWTVGSFDIQGTIETAALRWDGSAWSLVPTPLLGTSAFTAVESIAPGEVWAVGGGPFGTIAEHWDGSAWNVVSSPNANQSGSNTLNGVARSKNGVWAVGSYQGSDSHSPLIEGMCPIRVSNAGFSPAGWVLEPGTTVIWRFPSSNSESHSATDLTGLDLFDSGARPPGSSYSFTFDASGLFSVIDTATSHTSVLDFPPGVRPEVGRPSAKFTVTWGAGPLPGSLVTDVRIQRPGAASFRRWITGTTAPSAEFLPDAGLGAYAFSARLRSTDTGARTGWSGGARAVVAVFVTDVLFDPPTVSSAFGMSVPWHFDEGNTLDHSATDASGMGLFDSGPEPPGADYDYTFVGAGTYAIVDTPTGDQGFVQVTMDVKPTEGTVSTRFRITWAASPPPSGLVFDIQIKRPGSPDYVAWRHGDVAIQAFFRPDAGAGTYFFQARLRKTSNGASSLYSPAASIEVTPTVAPD